jgi:hypothetical protein
MYTVTGMGNRSRLKEQKNYASARKRIIEASPRISYLACPNVFDRLVPFGSFISISHDTANPISTPT